MNSKDKTHTYNTMGKLYHNPDGEVNTTPLVKTFGEVHVKKYKGRNPNLLALNKSTRFMGTIEMAIPNKSIWYFYPSDDPDDPIRIPEPPDGIESIFDLHFRRNEVAEKEGGQTDDEI